MSTSVIHILWLKFIREDKYFCPSFPIPLYIFIELLDCVSDLIEFTYFLVPKKKQDTDSSFTVQSAKILTQKTIDLFYSLAEDESYYLFDVKINKIRISAKIT